MSRVGINNNDCFDPNKLTEAEHNAIGTIIGSLDRRKMILELITNKMCEISDENTAFISGMLPEVIAKYTSQVENRVRTMRHSLEMVGPMMYDMLRRKIDIPDYELLLYIRTTWDWKKMYEDSLNRNDCRMVKTSELVRGIEFADHIVYQFRKLIDRIDLKKPLVHYSVNDCVKDQLPIPIVDMFPDTHEFLSWCKKNRKLWDDLPKNWKPDNLNPQKKAKKK
jgi:hypothetical protein